MVASFIHLLARRYAAAAAAKSLQSCLTLCDPIDSSPTRFPRPWDSPGKNTGVGCHFLFQCMKVKLLSLVQLLETPWTVAYQAPLSMGFSRQEWGAITLLGRTGFFALANTSKMKGTCRKSNVVQTMFSRPTLPIIKLTFFF